MKYDDVTTNPIWRTAAILKIVFWLYLDDLCARLTRNSVRRSIIMFRHRCYAWSDCPVDPPLPSLHLSTTFDRAIRVQRRASSVQVVLHPRNHFPSILPSTVTKSTTSLLLFQWQYVECFRRLICSKMTFSSSTPIFSRIHVCAVSGSRSLSLVVALFSRKCRFYLFTEHKF